MKLIDKATYKEIELILLNAQNEDLPDNTKQALKELHDFFYGSLHYEFIKAYYFNRYKYKYSCPNVADLFKKIYHDLYIEEPTLYQIKKEVIYKAAMIFYKNGVLK